MMDFNRLPQGIDHELIWDARTLEALEEATLRFKRTNVPQGINRFLRVVKYVEGHDYLETVGVGAYYAEAYSRGDSGWWAA